MRLPWTSAAVVVSLLGLVPGCGDGGTPNEPPAASLDASSSYIKALEVVTFTITTSDPEGGTVNADIDFGDGNSQAGVGSSVQHTFDAEGDYTVSVEATDDRGAAANASLNVTVTPAGGSPNIRLNAVTLHIGTTEGPLDQVTVNGNAFPTDGGGNADVRIPLESGITSVSITGEDAAGNQGSEDLEFEIQ